MIVQCGNPAGDCTGKGVWAGDMLLCATFLFSSHAMRQAFGIMRRHHRQLLKDAMRFLDSDSLDRLVLWVAALAYIATTALC